MDKNPHLPPIFNNKWIRLSLSLLMATVLAGLILFVPISRSKSLILPGPSAAGPGRIGQVSLPLGAEVVYAADGLLISKSALPSNQVNHGDLITYTLFVQNLSAGPITQLKVTDTIPLNSTCLQITDVPDGFNQWNGNDPKCLGQQLAEWVYLDTSTPANPFTSGESVSLIYVVRVSEPLPNQSQIINNQYHADPVDPNLPPSTGQITVTHLVNAPNWQISKTVSPTPTVEPDDLLEYTITAKNNGNLTTEGTYTITDQIPANTTFVAASTPGSYSGVTNRVTWVFTNTPLAINASKVVTFSVRVDNGLADATPIINQNYSVTGGNVFSAGVGLPLEITVDTPVTVTVSKVESRDPVPAGQTLAYTLTVVNDASSKGPADNVVVTDTLPANVVLLDAGFISPVNGTVVTSPLPITWRISDSLTIGQSVAMFVNVRVDAPLVNGTVLTNNYEVSAANTTVFPVVAPPLITTTVVSTPDLRIRKVDNPNEVKAGDPLIYTIAYSNTGNANASGVIIRDTLPNVVSYVSSTPPGSHDGSPLGGVIVWNIGSLAALGVQSGLITVSTVVSSPLPDNLIITNTAIISAAEGVKTTAIATTTINSAPQFHITKSVVPTPTVDAGALLTYTLIVSNSGNANAVNVVLTDTIPNNTQFVSASPGFSPAAPSPGNPITWSIPSLIKGIPQLFTMTVRVNNPLANNTKIPNVASVGDATARVTSNIVTSTVTSVPDLQVRKVGLPQPVIAGQLLTYTLNFTNAGNADAIGVVITDIFPAQTTFVSATPPGTALAGGRRWDIGPLAGNGGTGLLTLTLRVNSPQDNGTILINNVLIKASNSVSSSGFATNTVSSAPILQVSKVAAPDPAKAGRDVVYTITFTNSGNMNAGGVVITDTYDGPGVISAPPIPTVTVAPPRVIWNVGQLPVDTPRSVTFSVSLPDTLVDGEVLTNSVTMANGQAVSASDTITTGVLGLDADLTIKKIRQGSGQVIIGNPITYTLLITNKGPDTVDMRISDTVANAAFSSITIAPPFAIACTPTPPAPGLNTICTVDDFTGTTSVAVILDTSNSISGTVANTAVVSPTNGAEELAPGDNTGVGPNVTVRSPVAQLSIFKNLVSSSSIVVGQPITYVLTVQNNGPDVVSTIVTDTFTNAAFSGQFQIVPPLPGGSCSGTGPLTVRCTLPNFKVGPPATSIFIRLNTTNSVSGTVTNSAQVGAAVTVVDNPADNQSTATPDVKVRYPIADLAINKTRLGSGTVLVGEPITYSLTITNRKGSDTISAQLIDTYTNAAYLSHTFIPSLPGASCNTAVAGQFTCTIPNFTNTATVILVLDTTNSSVPGTVSNSAVITPTAGNVIEPNPADNQSQPPDVDVDAPLADLQLAKTTVITTIGSGGLVTFTLVVTNAGPDTTDVVVSDFFNTTVASFASCTLGCSDNGSGLVTWPLNNFTGTQVLQIVLQPSSSFSGTLINDALINFAITGVDPGAGNETDTATVRVVRLPKVIYLPMVIKTSPPPPPATPTPTPIPPPGGATPTPTPTPTPTTGPPTSGPDLVISQFSINPSAPGSNDTVVVTIVVKNQGDVASGSGPGDGFWTDFYVDPVTLPNNPALGANRRWDVTGSSQGIAWAVPALAPGQSITLTSDGSGGGLAPDPAQTTWSGKLPGGPHNLYAFVDSFDNNDPTGPTNVEVVELNENNNMAGPITLGITANSDETPAAPAPVTTPVPRLDLGLPAEGD